MAIIAKNCVLYLFRSSEVKALFLSFLHQKIKTAYKIYYYNYQNDKEVAMKNIMMLSALTGVLALTGCTTLKSVVGNDMSGTHEVQATNKNTAPVASKNGVLVDATNYMTLYTYDKDSMNKSDCGAACQVVWPIFQAPSNAKASGQFAAFKREDGKYQWAMNGKPLYFYANDTKMGDKDGDDKFDVWHVIPTK